MKKHIIYLLALISIMAGCKEEEQLFAPGIGSEAFSFQPISGGAVMKYRLPADGSLMGINVRYKDFKGKEILRTGSVYNDTLVLVGFNEATKDNPATVTLVRKDGTESEPISTSFSTKDSGAYAFFNGVKVMSGWDGFFISTDNAADANGIAHVFYLGTNPYTGKSDTILLKDFVIKAGKDTMEFSLKQKIEKNTIIIRTEDFRGYMVREEAYPNIYAYNTSKLDPSNFTFECEKSIEDETRMMGSKYLFDGDVKGDGYYPDKDNSKFRFYVAGPHATDVPMYIDLGKNRLCAQIRLYAMLYINRRLGLSSDKVYGSLFGYNYFDKVPCDIEVFGAREGSGTGYDNMQWERLGSYSQDPKTTTNERWSRGCFNDGYLQVNQKQLIISSWDQAQEVPPVSLSIGFLPDKEAIGYRYLKIIPHQVFYNKLSTGVELNLDRYVALQELEVYTRTEE